LNKYRGIIVLFVAIVFGLLAASIASCNISRFPHRKSADETHVKAVIAAKTIKPNEEITSDKLKIESRPRSEVPPNAVTGFSGIIGKRARDYVYEGDIVRKERVCLEDGSPGSGVLAGIDDGKVALSIHVSEVSGVSGLLKKGDLVDIIATSTIDIPNFTGSRISRVIARGVRVLSGQVASGSGQSVTNTVTLLVTPEQASVISAADEAASLRLVAGNNKDAGGDAPVGIFTRELGPGLDIPSVSALIEQEVGKNVKGASIKVSPSPHGIILYGEVDDQETMDTVLQIVASFTGKDNEGIKNLMRLKGPQQVQLEVKVAEISRSALKKMGLGVLDSKKNLVTGAFTSGDVSAESGSDISGINSLLSMTPSFTSTFDMAVHYMSENNDIMSIISIMKSQGNAKILAEPTLIAMSGKEASFLVGGQFPVPAKQDQDIFIQFQDYGVMLAFVPTVIRKDTINLMVATEVSELDYSAGVRTADTSTPGTKTRKAKTSLQLKDGQSFAMAGLMKETSNLTVNKVPLLGDIPVLGALFRKKEWTKDEMELVILVTARLISPMNKHEVPPLPGEGEARDPNDLEFFIGDKTR
jgi:pilus assembly protein CpaC